MLDDEIRACRRCEGMNKKGVTQAAPGWGSIDSPVAIVGQSLCEQCMKPQEPFYEGSGSLLNTSFERAGCRKADLFITNAVHCHPRKNRGSHDHEIVNCSPYLLRELEIVRPRLVIGLGEDAERVLSFIYPTARTVPWPFSAPRYVRSKTVPCLHFAKHPSWVKRQHDDALEATYAASMAEALKWAIGKGALRS
ncbi:uracil-DNA glycosylase family protein [Mycolicibacterium palauense]|uniref:uracil-DNA glycosylase family protein n=1 Tax=Mycolicibacterium palauense TaxID=2034511 RepID=UPI002E213DE4